jgi:AraC-like DNA-binding protein
MSEVDRVFIERPQRADGFSPDDVATVTLRPIVTERRLRKVLDLIESQPRLSVSELALEVHLTPAHLQRLFKRFSGVHISRLICEYRLQKAAHLLSSSELAIKEIAHAVGYEHHSSFVRAFYRRFAQSPKHYRRTGHDSPCDSALAADKAAAD